MQLVKSFDIPCTGCPYFACITFVAFVTLVAFETLRTSGSCSAG